MQAVEVTAKAASAVSSVAYSTSKGTMHQGLAEEILAGPVSKGLLGQVQLVFTSPPFPLNSKKQYGNRQGEDYLRWLADFAQPLSRLLTPSGSIVIELGNAWVPGRPIMSTLAMEALLAFLKAADLVLCQQFVCHNPARLPTPAQWVTIERIRAKDAYTNVWWMAKTDRPKADNRRVLSPYSKRMRQLLERGSYNSGKRPSEHNIGVESFLRDNGGAIPSNVLTIANTASSDPYLNHCRRIGLTPHPARMPTGLAQFFIEFLTDPDELVLDPFAGSNTTGAAAEAAGRRWLSIEPTEEYILGSKGRFPSLPQGRDESR